MAYFQIAMCLLAYRTLSGQALKTAVQTSSWVVMTLFIVRVTRASISLHVLRQCAGPKVFRDPQFICAVAVHFGSFQTILVTGNLSNLGNITQKSTFEENVLSDLWQALMTLLGHRHALPAQLTYLVCVGLTSSDHPAACMTS